MGKTITIGKGSKVRVVGEYADIVAPAIEALTGEAPVVSECAAGDEKFDLTVAIGVDGCSCGARVGASKALEEVDKRSYFDARYAIYMEDGRLVILYDRNEYTDLQGGKYAAETFVKRFIADREEAVFEEGLVRSGYFDLIEYQKAIDAKTKEEKWTAFRAAAVEKYGEDFGNRLTDAFAQYYSIFRPELAEWYARIYDPAIGGFYASISGREHFGYLPMVEWTYRALGHLHSFGIMPGSWTKCLPVEMRHKIGYFAKSCQHPNGYFYHPQMIKAETDHALNSRGRNLGCGVAMLTELGMKPTYPTPRDDPYDGISADEWWDSRVAAGEISPDEQRPFVPKSLYDYELWLAGKPTFKTKDEAMERETYTPPKQNAVSASTSSGEYLKSHKGFSDYLDTKDIDNSPYASASELNGTYRIIAGESKKLGKCEEEGFWYSGMTLCEMTIDWLNRHINATGLFGLVKDPENDPYAGCKYANTNGLMKAIPIYNEWGIAYPEPLKAARSCLKAILSPEPSVGNICETYNIWAAFSGLIGNVKKYAPEADREIVLTEIRKTLEKTACDAVINTYNKQKRYQKDDGGFSHNIYRGLTKFMGGVHGGIGINEANVDANSFGVNSTIGGMLSCFELAEYKPPMYFTWNFMKYLDIVLKAEHPKKKRVPENFLE